MLQFALVKRGLRRGHGLGGIRGTGCCFIVVVMVREGELRERGNGQRIRLVNNLKGVPNVMAWEGFFFSYCWGSGGRLWDG